LAGIGLCAAATFTIARSVCELQEIEQRRARFESASTRATVTAVDTVAAAEAAAVNAAIVRLNLPWPEVFDAVERATPDSVALLSLEPDARQDVIRVVAETGSTAEMLRYVERLKQQPFLAEVFLVRHEIDSQNSNLPLRFQVEAHWSPQP
jgi:Tfp pilus assembly protein PilN